MGYVGSILDALSLISSSTCCRCSRFEPRWIGCLLSDVWVWRNLERLGSRERLYFQWDSVGFTGRSAVHPSFHSRSGPHSSSAGLTVLNLTVLTVSLVAGSPSARLLTVRQRVDVCVRWVCSSTFGARSLASSQQLSTCLGTGTCT
jgi:hypothetical protein